MILYAPYNIQNAPNVISNTPYRMMIVLEREHHSTDLVVFCQRAEMWNISTEIYNYYNNSIFFTRVCILMLTKLQ